MNDIPAEIAHSIAAFVASKPDLKSMCLVSKSLSDSATRELFSNAHIVLPDAASDPEIIDNLRNIIASSTLAKAVHRIKYTTSLEPNKILDDYNNDEEWTKFGHEMEDAIDLLNKFSNLTSLDIEFSCVCAKPEPGNYWSTSPEESYEFRLQVLKSAFAALNNAEYPMPQLRRLSIKNLQNVNDKAWVRSEDFLCVLKRISELRLKIVTEHDSASPEIAWDFPERHNFMKELPTVWLEPARMNLTTLTSYTYEAGCGFFDGNVGPSIQLKDMRLLFQRSIDLILKGVKDS